MNRIYLDNAATTPVGAEVLEAMLPYFAAQFGNASGVHATSRSARKALEQARRQIAAVLDITPGEVFFTSGGTESDNWAVKGAAFALKDKGRHIITTAIEHHAVLHACAWLEQQGFSVTYLPVDGAGLVDPADVESAITKDTILISVMAANNETGVLQPVADIGAVAKRHGVMFHTDAVQAAGAIKLNAAGWQADMISLSAHKVHGPKGTGVLYVRDKTPLDALVHGGAQEKGRRAGTENLPGIVGCGLAMELAEVHRAERVAYVGALRDRLYQGLCEGISGLQLNGDAVRRLPGNLNISIPDIDGEALLLRLDLAGIAASSGAACTAGTLNPSHVLKAMGLPDRLARGSIRFSLAHTTTQQEIDETLRIVPDIVRAMRA
jgi:cysteine desulfurase